MRILIKLHRNLKMFVENWFDPSQYCFKDPSITQYPGTSVDVCVNWLPKIPTIAITTAIPMTDAFFTKSNS